MFLVEISVTVKSVGGVIAVLDVRHKDVRVRKSRIRIRNI